MFTSAAILKGAPRGFVGRWEVGCERKICIKVGGG